MGAFLFQLFQNRITAEKLAEISEERLVEFLRFANHFCSISVQKKGAIASYPTMEEINTGK